MLNYQKFKIKVRNISNKYVKIKKFLLKIIIKT